MNVNEKETTLTRAGSAATRKLVLTAMFTCLAFVLNTFVYFPAMAPFQHFVNVMAAVMVGPWYGSVAGALCGVLRMLCGRTGYRLHYRRHVRPHLRRLAVPEVRHLVVRVDRRDHRHRRHRRHGVLSPV